MFGFKNQKQEKSATTNSAGVDNRLVTICQVRLSSSVESYDIYVLPVLAILKRHKFEIKPFQSHYSIFYFCELRDDAPPCFSQMLDQAMKDAIPLAVRNKKDPLVYWTFA